ncbi:hypothetical protein V8J88_20985 [Massilia sp. W12]|uniref:hypothetical protein n=1 Tax=Massilia sp. W12 TaxID=3126507 RepID=UPI0030CE428A
MLIIPLQLSLAAISAICQHEQGAAANHPGHHEHKHDSSVQAEASGATDPDCGPCHDVHQPAPLESRTQTALFAVKLAPPDYLAHLSHPPHHPPERPQWRRPA